MEVEIIHKGCIKPASPTPNNLRTYKISLLDQLLPTLHVPIFFFYPFNLTNDPHHLNTTLKETRQKLKASLSKTLTHYYPFAGKIKDDHDLYIDCNDEGVHYVETLVKNQRLSRFLEKPDLGSILQLAPCHPDSFSSNGGIFVLMVQVSIFECGGIVVCLSTSHKIFDGTTAVSFFKDWATISRSSEIISRPIFISNSLFPQNPSLPKDTDLFGWPNVFKQGKSVTRRFVFSASAINKLKAKVMTRSSSIRSPTKVEVISAIIWRSILIASRSRNHSKKPSLLSFPVNLRKRKSPEWPENVIGNLLWNATAQTSPDSDLELNCLVGHIREAKAKINNQFIEEIQGREGFFKVQHLLKELRYKYSDEDADYISTTSLLNTGVYDADFGWGKPVWVSMGGLDSNISVIFNLIILIENRFGDGIEATMSLDEGDMAIVERDPELLSYASLDPSPCMLRDPVLFHPRL